jgi:hypothetical protein
LDIEYFIKSSYSSFEAKVKIWKKETALLINTPDISEKNAFEQYSDIISSELNFIEKNKSHFEEILYNKDIIELAENITSSSTLLQCASEECYVLDDGSKVTFPITRDDFFKSLYIETITISFDENKNFSLELILSCIPDYFRGSYFVVNIDNKRNIEFSELKD